MAIEVLTNAYVFINSVDLSDHVSKVTLEHSADVLEATVRGDTGKRRLAGLKDWSATVEFRQDFASGKVDATIFPLVGAAQFPVAIKKDKTAAISATNPEFQGNAVIDGNYSPVNAGVGDLHNTSVKLVGADGVALVRDVTP